MAVSNGLDFAIAYVCVLALFSYLAFTFLPAIIRAAYGALVTWLEADTERRPRDPDHLQTRGRALTGGCDWEG